MKKFPYLVMRDLSKEQRERLIADLEVQSENIRFKFASLVARVEMSIGQSKIIINNLQTFFEASGLEELANKIESTDTVSDVISKVTRGGYWTFFNYYLLENLMTTFCKDENKIIADFDLYITEIKEYCKRRLYEVPIHVFTTYSDDRASRLCMKLDKNFSIGLSDVRKIQDRVSKLLGIKYLYLVDVQDGCVELIFRFFTKLDEVKNKLEEIKEDLVEFKVKGIWVRSGAYEINGKL